MSSIFNPRDQVSDVSNKIVTGLERISEAYKVLLWEKAKLLNLSPIQIQILIFIAHHNSELCKVSYLAREFNITKPTVSDAIKILIKKELVEKDTSPTDSRSYSILLTKNGKKILSQIDSFADPIRTQLNKMPAEELNQIFFTISKLVFQLNQAEILTIQRTCFSCQFYDKSEGNSYCNLLNMPLAKSDIRLDCLEYEPN